MVNWTTRRNYSLEYFAKWSDIKSVFLLSQNFEKDFLANLNATVDELLGIWAKARLPTAFQPNIVSKLKGVINDCNLIKKNKARIMNEAQHVVKRSLLTS